VMVSVEAREWTRPTKAVNSTKTALAVVDAILDMMPGSENKANERMSVEGRSKVASLAKEPVDGGTGQLDKW
jgi:hypothetical protein